MTCSMDINAKWLALVAVAGTLGAFWQQARASIMRIWGLLFCSVTISGQAAMALIRVLRNESTVYRPGYAANFVAQWVFTGAQREAEPALHRAFVDSIPRLYRWRGRVFRVSCVLDGSKHGIDTQPTLRVDYVVGLFDLQALFAAIMAEIERARVGDARSRHCVFRLAGQNYGRAAVDQSNRDPGAPRAAMTPATLLPFDCWHPVGRVDRADSREDTRTLERLWLGPAMRQFVTLISDWAGGQKWFEQHGLPWRYGAAVTGERGTGKTSTIMAAARALDIPIVIVDISSHTNQTLAEGLESFSHMRPRIVLYEDIDRVFEGDRRVNAREQVGVTFDWLLNLLDGALAGDGVFSILTMNDETKLDPALLRPMRAGHLVRAPLLDEEGFTKITGDILGEEIPHALKAEEYVGRAPAALVADCCELALSHWRHSALKTAQEQYMAAR